MNLQRIDIDNNFKQIIQEKIPNELIKTLNVPGSRNGQRYIKGCTVIDILNRLANYNWDWSIDKAFIQESVPYMKKGFKEAIPQKPVCHVFGTLTVHLQDKDTGNIISIKKSASGSQIINGNDTEQESIFKAAGTDALKKAASLLGIGTELYRDKEEQYIFDNMYNSLDYWEDENIQKQYKKELQYLNNIQQKYNLSDYEIDETIRAWSNNKYTNFKKLPPEELNSFINYVKDTLAEDELGDIE